MVRFLIKTIALAAILITVHQSGLGSDRIPIFVSIAPQKYFVQQIGKDLVDVHVMVQPGAAPHIYEPKPRQMVAISSAQLYFAIGVEFERAWLKKIAAANPKMKVVHTDAGIEKIPMAIHHRHAYDSSRPDKRIPIEEFAQHGGVDPHIWLSPPLVKKQIRSVLTALQEIDPSRQTIYETNYREFVTRIDELDTRLRAIFAGRQGLRFMVFHPAWGYFADAYGIEQVPIEIEGKDPKPARLQELIGLARANGIEVIFAQPQYSTKSAKLLAKEMGGRVVFADPLAEDWMANLRHVADQFNAALK